MSQWKDFDEFYDQTMPRMFRALLLYAGNRELAADATAEGYTEACCHWDRLRNPEAWVRTVAHNYIKRHRRQVGNREVLECSLDEGLEMTAEALARAMPLAAQADLDLVKAVADLPAQQRAVVGGRYVLGLRPWEVAEYLGIDRRTESEHHRRAIRTLRSGLGTRR